MGGVRAAASEVRDGRRRSCGEWRRAGAAASGGAPELRRPRRRPVVLKWRNSTGGGGLWLRLLVDRERYE